MEKEIRCTNFNKKINRSCERLLGFSKENYLFVKEDEEWNFKTKCPNCKAQHYLKIK